MLGVAEWAEHLTGLRDVWTALQFDYAVMTIGTHLDNKLDERDANGNRINTLQVVLELPMTEKEIRAFNQAQLDRMKSTLQASHARGVVLN